MEQEEEKEKKEVGADGNGTDQPLHLAKGTADPTQHKASPNLEELLVRNAPRTKAGSAKAAREKKAAKKAAKAGEPLAENACAACGMQCGSRNKLFKHLQETGHAQPPRPR